MKVLIFLLAICASTYAVRFSCEFSMVTHVLVGARYTCTATVLDLAAGLNLTNVTGTHLLGFNNSNVEAVIIHNQAAVTFIPQQMRLTFSKITAISVTACGMTGFTGTDLNEYIDLDFFSVFNNRIVRVPGDLFHRSPRMRLMNFNNNHITRVGTNLIEPLYAFNYALFSDNPCINFSVTNSSKACLVGILRSSCPDVSQLTFNAMINMP